MEITSSKGHAFRTEPRCDVSVHEGRAAGGSGNRARWPPLRRTWSARISRRAAERAPGREAAPPARLTWCCV